MFTIQLLVQAEDYARELALLLHREGCDAVRSSAPDFTLEGAIVADRRALERHPVLLEHPERVILIAPNDPNFLSLLWKHRMRSVVFEKDPPGTVVLAVLATGIGDGGLSGMDAGKNGPAVSSPR